jgi:hypothetical protein
MLTTILGIAGAFLATFVGQADGHYGPDQGSKAFETEAEAKNFARIKFAEGNAGTINPYSPRQAVVSSPHPLLA